MGYLSWAGRATKMPLQSVIFHGRDCRIVFQNEANLRFYGQTFVGSRAVGLRSGDWSLEEVRDAVYCGRSVSIANKELHIRDRDIVASWTYDPIYDAKGRVTGINAYGLSLPAGGPTLLELAAWLESMPPSAGLKAGSFPLPTCQGMLVDSRLRLAESIRLAHPPRAA